MRRLLDGLAALGDTFKDKEAGQVLQQDVSQLVHTLVYDEQGRLRPGLRQELDRRVGADLGLPPAVVAVSAEVVAGAVVVSGAVVADPVVSPSVPQTFRPRSFALTSASSPRSPASLAIELRTVAGSSPPSRRVTAVPRVSGSAPSQSPFAAWYTSAVLPTPGRPVTATFILSLRAHPTDDK